MAGLPVFFRLAMTRMAGTSPAMTKWDAGIMVADKLVLQRQRHLKWRAFDRLELVLMIALRRCCASASR